MFSTGIMSMKVNCSVCETLVTLRLSVWEILVPFIWAKPGFLSLLCLQTKHHKYLCLHFTVQVSVYDSSRDTKNEMASSLNIYVLCCGY